MLVSPVSQKQLGLTGLTETAWSHVNLNIYIYIYIYIERERERERERGSCENDIYLEEYENESQPLIRSIKAALTGLHF